MMPQEEKKHKRRVHYSGKYPKKFEEKYKELQPEKYGDRKFWIFCRFSRGRPGLMRHLVMAGTQKQCLPV